MTLGSTVQSRRVHPFTSCTYVIACGVMAKLCTCWRRPPSGYSGRVLLLCVRGLVVHARCALPSVYIDCDVSMSTVRKRNQLTCLRMSKSVRSPDAWLRAAPLSSPMSSVSELVSLSRPYLPRTNVLGSGVAAGGRV